MHIQTHHLAPKILLLVVLFTVFSAVSLSAITIGTPGATVPEKYYFESGVRITGNLNIVGPVIIVSDGDFDIGNRTVTIANGGSLDLFVSGDVAVSGNGSFNNSNDPINLKIFGTNPDSQTIELNGNAVFSGIIYAPNATIDSNGGGNSGAFYGAAVANDITFNGNPGPFHFDEALGNIDLGMILGYEITDYRIAGGPTAPVAPEYLPEGFEGGSQIRAVFNHYFAAE